MARLAVLFIIGVSAVTAKAQTVTQCPWLTSGTAERFLGGEVSVTTRVDGTTKGACSFVHQAGTSSSSIEILVGPEGTHACSKDGAKLRGLGNEAVECHHNIATQQSDQIAGRIRNIYFLVTMTNVPGATTREPSDPRLADSFGASPVERLAELVVGNLY
jgi:hypothetical protein